MDFSFEKPVEMGQVIEAAGKGDIDDFVLALPQKEETFFQTTVQEVVKNRFSRVVFEEPAKVLGLDSRLFCEGV